MKIAVQINHLVGQISNWKFGTEVWTLLKKQRHTKTIFFAIVLEIVSQIKEPVSLIQKI